MADVKLTNIAGGGSPFPFPTLPAALNDGRAYSAGNNIPHDGTLINNIELPTAFNVTSTGYIVGRLNETTVWTIAATDIDAACSGFLCINAMFYDNINDRLYIFGLDTSPYVIYSAYITLETGAVTVLGNTGTTTAAASTTAGNSCAVWRAAVDSGNFTLFFNDRTMVIDGTTGALVSNTADANADQSFFVGSYATADGALLLSAITTSTSNYVILSTGGHSIYVPSPSDYLSSNAGMSALPWGDKVKMHQSSSAANTITLRTFDRAEFDALLLEIAEFGGLI